jgi:uncharacterized membrane protein
MAITTQMMIFFVMVCSFAGWIEEILSSINNFE